MDLDKLIERIAKAPLAVKVGVVLGALAVAVLALGIWPKPLSDVMEPTLRHLVQLLSASKL